MSRLRAALIVAGALAGLGAALALLKPCRQLADELDGQAVDEPAPPAGVGS